MTITEILQDLNIPFQHGRPGWLNLDCPWCGVPGKPGLGIPIDGWIVNCWKCGTHRLGDALAESSGRPLAEIFKLLGETERTWKQPEKVKGKLKLPPGLGNLLWCHRRYLENRGFDPDELERLWGIKGIDMQGVTRNLSWRIWIPVQCQGETVSWTTRSISDYHPVRYLNAKPTEESVSLKHILYGGDFVRHAMIIVEGPTDAWRIGPGAVATLGVNYTQAQLSLMAKTPVRVVCFDSEPEAQRRARQLCSALESFPGRTYRVELRADDPGSATSKEIKLLRKKFLDG